MTENIGSERFLDTDDTAQAPPRRLKTNGAASSDAKQTDILAEIESVLDRGLSELKWCEDRAKLLREKLGLAAMPAGDTTNVFATVVEHTNDDADDDDDDDEEVAPKRAARAIKAPKVKKAAGRLARRSAEQISADVARIVSLVKKSKAGLRAEEIRKELNLLPKEMPRLIKEGVKSRSLKSKGEKRATVYSAA